MRAGNQMGHWSTARRGHQRTTDVVRSEGPTEEEAGYRSYKRARGELNAGGPCGRFLLERIRVTLQGGEARCRKLVTLGTGAGHNRVIQDQQDQRLGISLSVSLSASFSTRRLLLPHHPSSTDWKYGCCLPPARSSRYRYEYTYGFLLSHFP